MITVHALFRCKMPNYTKNIFLAAKREKHQASDHMENHQESESVRPSK